MEHTIFEKVKRNLQRLIKPHLFNIVRNKEKNPFNLIFDQNSNQ